MSKPRRPKGRAINGILVLDKPLGFSSNAALQKVKWLYQAMKAGHTGALDPLATGVLPLCLGEATKFSQILLDSDKRYLTTVKLGQLTATGDAEGAIQEEKPVPELNEALIRQVLQDFTGEIQQIPPMYSALKHQGRPLYELARKGEVVDIQPRTITIYELMLHGFSADSITFEVSCSKGTYVRTLGQDIAAALGTVGHLSALRRLKAGPYTAEMMITLDELIALAEQGHDALDAKLLPMFTALGHIPVVELNEAQAATIRHGQAVTVAQQMEKGQVQLRLRQNGQEILLGLGEYESGGLVSPKRLVVG
ncbi:MAG: tRNA pseudouridine(55) synthase TruB [Oceanospirillaceae bacterium]|nr:tRNA pseudouridine(55) synthase TruB [Oceanospirillaceae bacterium]MCP5335573.1 tRNA pseudouridine(55) synthase TruB [Oceanospirillaceae bacterium]MCP5350205.1 tRNA pseudouridine(55) synthase TruB [Oceanospirillaceae bacterium]